MKASFSEALLRRVLLPGIFWPSVAFAQVNPEKPAELSAEEKVISEKANAYVATYNKADAKALAAFFAEDAEWVNESGQVLKGRPEIEATLKAALTASKGRKLDLDVESARALTGDVLLEKGTSTMTEADGHTFVSSYTAVHIKKGNDWLISQLTETGAPLVGNSEVQLRELEWMIGNWEDKSPSANVKTTVNWTPNRTFLTRSFTASIENAGPHQGTEVIGWDPGLGKIRSWVFESDGSFAENVWTRDGNRWLIQSKVTLPDGRHATAQDNLSYIDQGKLKWSSANRQVDGELLPNIDPIEIIRIK